MRKLPPHSIKSIPYVLFSYTPSQKRPPGGHFEKSRHRAFSSSPAFSAAFFAAPLYTPLLKKPLGGSWRDFAYRVPILKLFLVLRGVQSFLGAFTACLSGSSSVTTPRSGVAWWENFHRVRRWRAALEAICSPFSAFFTPCATPIAHLPFACVLSHSRALAGHVCSIP